MRIWKYITVAVVITAILLVTSWLLRNTLIERLSTPLLQEYGLKITDVSLDALASRDASIGYLELQHADGVVIAIEDLTLPIRKSASGFRRFDIRKVGIELPPSDADELADLAGTVNQLLELPLLLPQTEIAIGEFAVPPYPVLRDLQWQTAGTNQRVAAVLASLSLAADVSQVADGYYVVALSFADAAAGSDPQTITADLRRNNSGISVDGSGSFDLRLWSPVIALLGMDTFEVESGLATVQFDCELSNDANQIPFLNAAITPTTPVKLNFTAQPTALRTMTVESASTTEISVTLADLQWTMRQAQASVSLVDEHGNDIALSLANFACRSGPSCAGDVRVLAERLHLPFADVERVEIAATQDIAAGDEGLRGRLRQDATVNLSGVRNPDVALARFDAKLSSDAEFAFGDGGWHFTARSVDVGIEAYSVTDTVTVSTTAFLDDLSAGHANQKQYLQTGVFASSNQANWNGRRIHLPGFRGRVSLEDTRVSAALETAGLATDAGIEASHDLTSGTGQLALRHAGLSFESQPLSGRITPRPRGWDIIAGKVDFDMASAWEMDGEARSIDATVSVRVNDLAGNWQDTAFAGLDTRIDARFDSASGFTVQPSTAELALLEIGIPVENLSARYTLHPGELSVDVADLRMSAFGGVITADPFSFSTARERNNLVLHVASIDLAEVLSIKEFEAIEISGRIGAELPVTIEGESVTVSGGKLTGDLPGGVIRYLPGAGASPTDATGIGFATRALSNFQYDALTSDVDYDANGNLKLQMRLTGRNPDLDSNRPVILNLGVENNVPQMLRSLQAARAVEEILERRLKE